MKNSRERVKDKFIKKAGGEGYHNYIRIHKWMNWRVQRGFNRYG